MEVDSVIVEHLQELGNHIYFCLIGTLICSIVLGAIPFVLTNVPQTLLTYSCENPVFGTTLNPLSADRTSGGSSGGEGALIASGGSLVGIGSDIGGSIRIPASFCGIVGFKASLLLVFIHIQTIVFSHAQDEFLMLVLQAQFRAALMFLALQVQWELMSEVAWRF